MKTKLLFILLFFSSWSSYSQCWTRPSAGGSHSAFVRADGTLWACGRNADGQLGNNSIIDNLNVTQIGSDTNWVMVSASDTHTVALKSNGTVWSWGTAQGQNDVNYIALLVPTQIGTATDWAYVSAGSNITLAIKTNGQLWTWGSNAFERLGRSGNSLPAQVITTGGQVWVEVSSSLKHVVGLKSDGTIWAWGSGDDGRLGNSSFTTQATPIQVGTDTNWKSIKAGDDHTIALKLNGTLWGWGKGNLGQLGSGSVASPIIFPVQSGTATNWNKISAGGFHNLAIKTDGTLWSWGSNNFGQLGINSTNASSVSPVQVGTLNNWIEVEAGVLHSSALNTNSPGNVWAWTWGYNQNGRLGDGTTTNRLAPISFNCAYTAPAAPTISNVSTSGVTATSAIVNYTLNANGASTTSLISYGEASAPFSNNTVGFAVTSGLLSGQGTITGLTPNTTYFYRIDAANASGTSQSPGQSFTTAAVAQTITFSNLTSSLITDTAATVSVTLANVCAGANYRLQYSTSPAFGGGTVDTQYASGGTDGIKNHNLTGLAPNTTYYFRFYAAANQACNAAQIVSATASFTTTNSGGSIMFSNLTSSLITNTSATVSVTLANVCAGSNYRLQYSTSADFTAAVVDTQYSTSGTNGLKNHPINGLTANTTYYFRFYATPNQACNPTQIVSATASFTTTSAIIAFSNLTSSSVTNTAAIVSVTVTNACPGSTYQLEYSTSPSFSGGSVDTQYATGGTDGVKNHALSGLTPNTTYYYRFYAAANQACNAIFIMSATASFTTLSTAGSAPAITAVSASPSTNTSTINYTISANGASTTSIVRYGLTNTNLNLSEIGGSVITGQAPLQTALTGLTPNTTYYYQVEATNAAGTAQSSILNFTTLAGNGLIAFSNLISSAITNTTATVSVTLSNVCAGANYQLQYSTSSVFAAGTIDLTQATGGTNGVKNHNLTNLLPGTTYYFRFYAAPNQACNTPQVVSVGAAFSTASTDAPSSISFSNLTSSSITNTTATVSATLANVCAGATYQLQYSTSPAFGAGTVDTQFPTGGTNGVKNHNLTGLTPNTLYYFRFYASANQACNTAQVVSSSANFTTTNTSTPPVTPTFTQIAAQCSGATFSLPTTSTNGITGTWSPAINNTATTTYTFTPTAGQNATTATMTVTVNPNVTPTFTAVNPICSGGTLAALPTTSTNGIAGTWSPALNNTATTTYTFTPTAGQCATTRTLVITVNPNVTPTFAAVSPICSGATLAALPTTSTNGITGTWSPALNNTATTAYTFTPTAGQCATTATLTITVNPNVTPTFTAVNPICSGGTLAALPTTSTNGITGTWSPALNNTATTTYTFTPTAGQCATTRTLVITVNPNVTPNFAAVNPICSGATLAALPTTSTNGITGTWSPALNNLATTTYTFTPTAGQCATTTTRTITVNPNVTPTFAVVNPICSGGTLAALPTTSTNGITGTWSPALNNTVTTTYTFTPTAGQCATTVTRTITVNPNVTPTFATVNPICSGATLVALPTTSTNGITGTWSPALNNTATTMYTFTPTAGQCATTASLTITVSSSIAPAFAGVNPICSGATLAALPTTSTNGITGTWSPALNNTATTTYTFTPTAGQCASTQTLIITVNQVATPTGNANQTFTQGATIASLVVSPSSVTWFASQANATANTNALPTTQVLVNGTTYYAVATTGTCRSASFAVTVTVTLGVTENAIKFIKLYPNPAQDILNIDMETEVKSVEIYTIQGQKVLTSNQKQINVSRLASGIYLVKVTDNLDAVATKRIIIDSK